jgi:hypothetical protein
MYLRSITSDVKGVLSMPLIPISSELPVVKVKFILPLEDFGKNNVETFKGFLINSTHAIYKTSYRELCLVQLKTTEDINTVIANGPSLSLGKLKAGQRVKKTVNEIADQLQVMTAWEFVAKVLIKDPMSVELNLTEKEPDKWI